MQSKLPAKGFLLVTTLWILTAITLALSYFALWLDRSVSDIQQLQAHSQADIDIYSTVSTLTYWFSTQTYFQSHLQLEARDNLGTEMDTSQLSDEELMQQLLNPNFFDTDNDGLRRVTEGTGVYLWLDDRPYQGINNTQFAVQDLGGLLPLRGINWEQVRRILLVLGVDNGDTQPLLDKFNDYIDIDNFNRLNGAEAYQYKEENLTPPTNRLLRTSAEVQAIMGWMRPKDSSKSAKITTEQHHRWQQLSTIMPSRGYPNFNTAPIEVLQSLPGIDHKTAELIIEARNRLSLVNERELTYLVGKLPLQSEYIFFIPSYDLRFSLWHPQGRKIQQWHLSLTPNDHEGQPWVVHYRLDLASSDNYKNPVEYLSTPLLAEQAEQAEQ